MWVMKASRSSAGSTAVFSGSRHPGRAGHTRPAPWHESVWRASSRGAPGNDGDREVDPDTILPSLSGDARAILTSGDIRIQHPRQLLHVVGVGQGFELGFQPVTIDMLF